MAHGVKRKSADASKGVMGIKSKKLKASPPGTKFTRFAKSTKPTKPTPQKGTKRRIKVKEQESEDPSTSGSDDAFYGFSEKESSDEMDSSGLNVDSDEADGGVKLNSKEKIPFERKSQAIGVTKTSSREAHAKQRALAKERKAAKPNADLIQRSKKIWEQLRRKSHVPREERRQLVAELFDIITGRVREFVFKHDSVRIIQCALKYSNMEQRKMIAVELQGEYKNLAESKYGKFMIAKMLVEGDAEIRDMIINEFYGHVRYLINHPEASWILDDTYRQVATAQQKAKLLKEWYGSEFALFKDRDDEEPTDNLAEILEQMPEKRKPIMNYLRQLINQLIQKKLTGFTMLHDAMLQYYLNTRSGSDEASEFLELIKGDEEGDLLKNLAFTKSGARVVCLALAHGTAKDRKLLLRPYKDTIEMLAFDQHGHKVLLAALDVIDDTKATDKSIFGELFRELLSKDQGVNPDTAKDRICLMATDMYASIVLLYPFTGAVVLRDPDNEILTEMHSIRAVTSKKNPEVRRKEHVREISGPLLQVIVDRADELVQHIQGCLFITEILLGAEGDKTAAMSKVAELAGGDPKTEGHLASHGSSGKMLKRLTRGQRFDHETKKMVLIEPPLGFANILYPHIKEHLADWACSPSSFVVVNMVEDEGFGRKAEVLETLGRGKKQLEAAAYQKRDRSDGADKEGKKGRRREKKSEKGEQARTGNAGAKLLLEKLK